MHPTIFMEDQPLNTSEKFKFNSKFKFKFKNLYCPFGKSCTVFFIHKNNENHIYTNIAQSISKNIEGVKYTHI